MQGRLYDARIGRFMQADPPFMESPGWSQGLNRYSYVLNNPLNLVDPSGFMEEHDHPDDDNVPVSESTDEATGMPVFEQSPITEEDGESFGVDEGSLNDNADEEAETSPGQGDPADESDVGSDSEGLGQDKPAWHIPAVLDWIGGFGVGYMQGVVPGGTFLPMPPGSVGYQLSVALGQLAGGVSGVIGGGLVAAGGTAATATGVAAPVSVPVAVAGGAVAVADAANVGNAVGNILKIGGADDPPSSSPPPAASSGGKPTVLQSGGNTINPGTAKALGLTKEQARDAMHALKPDVGAPNDKIGKIMSNGDYVDKDTGKVLGNLFDYVD